MPKDINLRNHYTPNSHWSDRWLQHLIWSKSAHYMCLWMGDVKCRLKRKSNAKKEMLLRWHERIEFSKGIIGIIGRGHLKRGAGKCQGKGGVRKKYGSDEERRSTTRFLPIRNWGRSHKTNGAVLPLIACALYSRLGAKNSRHEQQRKKYAQKHPPKKKLRKRDIFSQHSWESILSVLQNAFSHVLVSLYRTGNYWITRESHWEKSLAQRFLCQGRSTWMHLRMRGLSFRGSREKKGRNGDGQGTNHER